MHLFIENMATKATKALKILRENDINLKELNLDNEFIIKHSKPIALVYAICTLNKCTLLTKENCNALYLYFNPQAITNALAAIPKTLATQENLNKLFELKNIEFLAYSGYLLYRIPENKFNQTVFDKLMELSTKKNSSQEIYNFINKLLRNENPSNNNVHSSKNCLSQENEINLPTLELKR